MNNASSIPALTRIESLLDPASFVEIGGLVSARATDFNLQQKNTPADGVITGYGTIEGCLVYVYSQDSSVLGGSIGEMHAKKIIRIYDMAMKMGAPVIGLIDCAGIRLQESTDALFALGGIYRKQAEASGVIPQITGLFGTCGGGLSVLAGLSDFVFAVDGKAKLFINSPNTIEGCVSGKDDSASVAFQMAAGNIDAAGTEEEIISNIRSLAAMLPVNNEDDFSGVECTDDLNRQVENIDAISEDAAAALSMIADNGEFIEVKKAYGTGIAVGFLRINGNTIGAVANRSAEYDEEGKKAASYDAVLTADGANKAAEFIRFCDAFNIPVLTLVDVKGMAAQLDSEKSLAKAAAKLTTAYAESAVAKVTLITGKAFGTAAVLMGSKSLGADMVYAWPESQVGMMDAASAVKIMYADEIAAAQDSRALLQEKTDAYAALQNNPLTAASHGYVDSIIKPAQTRQYIAAAFEMLYTKSVFGTKRKHSAK